MANLNKFRRQVAELERRHALLLKQGRIVQALALRRDIDNVQKMIDAEEEARKPKPIQDLIPKDKLAESGLVELMIECHLIADFLNAVVYEIIDKVDEFGYSVHNVAPELREIADKTQKFASYMCTKDENLSDMMTDNETLINALHKKTLSYIQQRFNRSKHAQ